LAFVKNRGIPAQPALQGKIRFGRAKIAVLHAAAEVALQVQVSNTQIRDFGGTPTTKNLPFSPFEISQRNVLKKCPNSENRS
jgi:hypothetical protein